MYNLKLFSRDQGLPRLLKMLDHCRYDVVSMMYSTYYNTNTNSYTITWLFSTILFCFNQIVSCNTWLIIIYKRKWYKLQLQLTGYLLSTINYIIHLYINLCTITHGAKYLDGQTESSLWIRGFSGDKSEKLEHDDQRAFISEKVEEDKRWPRESMSFRPSFPVIPWAFTQST